MLLRYPTRPTAPPAPAELPAPASAAEVETLAELALPATPEVVAFAVSEPRVVPVVVPRREPRTVPVVPPTGGDRVRISTEVYMESVAEDAPPA